jgi:hypothetical protein
MLYLACCLNAFTSGYVFKKEQIKEYNWIKKNSLNKCVCNMDKLQISKSSKYEVEYKMTNNNELYGYNINGYIDCISNNKIYNTIYEFKCVSTLDKTHFLQLALYMYMYKSHNKILNGVDNNKYVLFNIITNEYFEIKCDIDKLIKIVEILIDAKYNTKEKINNDSFIQKNILLFNKYKYGNDIYNKYMNIVNNNEIMNIYYKLKNNINYKTNRPIKPHGSIYNEIKKKYFMITDSIFFKDFEKTNFIS